MVAMPFIRLDPGNQFQIENDVLWRDNLTNAEFASVFQDQVDSKSGKISLQMLLESLYGLSFSLQRSKSLKTRCNRVREIDRGGKGATKHLTEIF